MECISEAQRNLLDYDVTYEILYSNQCLYYLHVIRIVTVICSQFVFQMLKFVV